MAMNRRSEIIPKIKKTARMNILGVLQCFNGTVADWMVVKAGVLS